MIPTTRWNLQWWLTTHHIKLQEKEVYLVKVEFDSCAPLVEMVYRGMPSKGVLVDEGKEMNVMTIFTIETLGLWCDYHSKCNLRINNNKKIKLERLITTISISIRGIIIIMDFQMIWSEIEDVAILSLGLQPRLGKAKRKWVDNKLSQERGLKYWGNEMEALLRLLGWTPI